MFKKNKVDWIKGWVLIFEVGKVKVGDDIYDVKNIIIVLGFELLFLFGIEIDEKVVVILIGVLLLLKIFKLMVVIGVGVIGFEMGLVY